MEILSQIAFDQEFANTGGKTLQLDRDEHVDITATARNSLAKSLLYHLRNLPPEGITDQFDGVRDRVFEVLRSQRRLLAFVDVAIVLHEWRFYGSADTDHVLTTYPDLGTNKTFCFATLCIVALRTRFMLAVVPIDANGFRAKRDAVRSLLKTAKQYVFIRHVYLDRGFYQVHVVAGLEQQDVDCVVRARPSSGMKDRLGGGETVADAYTMQRKRNPTAPVDVTVFAVPHRTREDDARLVRDKLRRRFIDSESIRGGVPPPLGDRNVISTARRCPPENVIADVLGAIVLLCVCGVVVQPVGVSQRLSLGWTRPKDTADLNADVPQIRSLGRLRLSSHSTLTGMTGEYALSWRGIARERR